MARYYVDTRAQPPRSSWDHPLGPLPPPPGNFQPPPNPPNRAYAGSGSSASFNQPQGQSYPAQPFSQEQSYTGGGYPGNQQNRTYQQPGFPPQQSYGGAAPANYGTPGWQGWQQPQPQGRCHVDTECSDTQAFRPPLGYPAQPQQTVQQPARGGGRGSVAPALLGTLRTMESVPRHITDLIFLLLAGRSWRRRSVGRCSNCRRI